MMLSHNPIVEPFALAHATIVTGDKAGTILRNMTIVVGADGRIEQVDPASKPVSQPNTTILTAPAKS